jgi:hypothetical protein
VTVGLDLTYTGDADMLKMVLVEVPLPVGFSADESRLSDLVSKKIVNDYEIAPGNIIRFYIDGVQKGRMETISFDITPRLVGVMTMQGVNAYDMYNDDRSITLAPITVEVTS